MANGNAKEKSEQPPDSDFQQQNLKAWQPLLTPGWVIGTFFTIGLIFLPIGIVVLKASENVHQAMVRYDSLTNADYINISIPEDMDPPIYFYYRLEKFYQNHRTYVKSRNDAQLRGDDDNANLDSCDPLQQFEGKDLYPCGLIANSYFSDDFEVQPPLFTRDGVSEELPWTDKEIAWKSDVDVKFKQGKYDPETMTNVSPNGVLLNHTREDFIVWMRTAGLPDFKKLRYIIKDTPLRKNDVVTVYINQTFDVASFGGAKHIVLSTTSWLGGKNDFLGYAYIVVASICLLLGTLFGIKHMLDPRKLGDMQYFKWQGRSAPNASPGNTN